MMKNNLLDTLINNLDLKWKNKNYKVIISVCYSSVTSEKWESRKWLHVKELKYYLTLAYEKRMKDYLSGRYVAKKAISAFVDNQDLGEILIQQGIFQQPIIKYPCEHNIQVSITHCDDLSASIVFPEEFPMGIDIEKISVKLKGTFKSQMTENEKEIVESFFYSEEAMLTLLWTAKESLSKVLKTGLTIPLEILEVTNLKKIGSIVLGEFKNLPQYCVSSIVFGEYVCSIVYPKNTVLSLDKVVGMLRKIEQTINNNILINI